MSRVIRKLVLGVVLTFVSTLLFAQNIEVTGVVKGARGEGLSGAKIVEYGSVNTAESDKDGCFRMHAKEGAVLFVSHHDYSMRQTIAADSVVVMMLRDGEDVGIGYGESSKDAVTGAITQLDDSAFSESDMSSLADAIQGLVAGVTVTGGSSMPGENPSIIVRGDASFIGADTQPLYVIDGMPMDGDPSIDPRSIRTVEFLKDAASCAVYGTRGAAGVILITTK